MKNPGDIELLKKKPDIHYSPTQNNYYFYDYSRGRKKYERKRVYIDLYRLK